MPFETAAGPAVMVANICDVLEIATRLQVHVNTIYQWIRNQEQNGFPNALPCGRYHFDYDEVFDWFQAWIKTHPGYYPAALEASA